MSEYENISTQLKEAERLGSALAESYDKGFFEKLRKANTSVVKAFNERYKAINYQHEYGLIDTEEYYRKLEQARDKYFSRDTQEWHKYTKEIYSYRKSAIEDYKNYVEQNLESLLEIVEDNRQNYKEKLLDYAGGTKGFDTHKTIVENYWPNGDRLVMTDYTLTDYEEEIRKLTEFNDAITKLKERASSIDPEVFTMFFEQLKNMSVEDGKILTDLLLDASEEDFTKHFQLYDKRNTLAENMSISYYADDYKALAESMSTELQQAFSELPADFFQKGQDIADGFAQGFISEMNSLIASLDIAVPDIPSGSETNNIDNNTFSPVYYFFGDRATTSRTRMIAKNDALYSYMRGLK